MVFQMVQDYFSLDFKRLQLPRNSTGMSEDLTHMVSFMLCILLIFQSFFCDKLSQKLRHIRWLRKRRSVQGEGSGIKHNKVTKYVALPNLGWFSYCLMTCNTF